MSYKNGLSRMVIALGGNALGVTPEEQKQNVVKAAATMVELMSKGNEVIITHGNGPQVGVINLAFDKASELDDKIPSMPLAECIAMSQGYIGYHLQNAIKNELIKRKMKWNVVTVVTQVEVDGNDEAFQNPRKPIGSFYTKEEADEISAEYPDMIFMEDAGRGYRRVVSSPQPKNIVEKESIQSLLENDCIVIACGGGGVPVVRDSDGYYHSVPAVIDKDFSSSKLADVIDADYLLILTAVDKIALNFGKADVKFFDTIQVDDLENYYIQGRFASGSMAPKVKAVIDFVKGGKERKAVIASLDMAPYIATGEGGTVIHN